MKVWVLTVPEFIRFNSNSTVILADSPSQLTENIWLWYKCCWLRVSLKKMNFNNVDWPLFAITLVYLRKVYFYWMCEHISCWISDCYYAEHERHTGKYLCIDILIYSMPSVLRLALAFFLLEQRCYLVLIYCDKEFYKYKTIAILLKLKPRSDYLQFCRRWCCNFHTYSVCSHLVWCARERRRRKAIPLNL